MICQTHRNLHRGSLRLSSCSPPRCAFKSITPQTQALLNSGGTVSWLCIVGPEALEDIEDPSYFAICHRSCRGRLDSLETRQPRRRILRTDLVLAYVAFGPYICYSRSEYRIWISIQWLFCDYSKRRKSDALKHRKHCHSDAEGEIEAPS